MSALRLLFVVSKYFPYGGLQRDLLRMAQACRAHGAEVDILVGVWEGEKPEGIGVIEQALTAWSNDGKNRELARRVARLRQERGYDAVIGFHKLPGLDVYFNGDTCFAEKIAQTKPGWFVHLPRYRQFLKLERAVFRADGDTEILVIAEPEIALFQRHYGTADERFHLLPPGIDRQRLLGGGDPDLQGLRSELGLNDGQKLLLHVGSDFRRKGVERLIRGVAALPESLKSHCAAVIVGQDDPAEYLRLAEQLGVAEQVKFTGGRQDVARFYRLATALVHPALTETAGAILVEALVCGVPVLCSGACGYASHVLRAGAGLVTPEPFEQSVFNGQLAQMLDAANHQRWQAAALSYAGHADLYSMIERSAAIILARAARNRARSRP